MERGSAACAFALTAVAADPVGATVRCPSQMSQKAWKAQNSSCAFCAFCSACTKSLYTLISLCNLCVLCVLVGVFLLGIHQPQRTQRLHREDINGITPF